MFRGSALPIHAQPQRTTKAVLHLRRSLLTKADRMQLVHLNSCAFLKSDCNCKLVRPIYCYSYIATFTYTSGLSALLAFYSVDLNFRSIWQQQKKKCIFVRTCIWPWWCSVISIRDCQLLEVSGINHRAGAVNFDHCSVQAVVYLFCLIRLGLVVVDTTKIEYNE